MGNQPSNNSPRLVNGTEYKRRAYDESNRQNNNVTGQYPTNYPKTVPVSNPIIYQYGTNILRPPNYHQVANVRHPINSQYWPNKQHSYNNYRLVVPLNNIPRPQYYVRPVYGYSHPVVQSVPAFQGTSWGDENLQTGNQQPQSFENQGDQYVTRNQNEKLQDQQNPSQTLGNTDASKLKDDNDMHRAACDTCDKSRMRGHRYRCLECTDFDLCGECFEKRRETEEHKSGHAMAHFKIPMELFGEKIYDVNTEVTFAKLIRNMRNSVHQIDCNGCSQNPIIGIRFKCDTCPYYNLCLSCMRNKVKTGKHTEKHPLIVIAADEIKEIPANDLKLGKKLGQGGFGSVYKATWLSKDRTVACKVVDKDPVNGEIDETLLNEWNIYNELCGIFIVKLYGYALQEIKSKQGVSKFYLIMEFVNRGCLTDILRQHKVPLSTKVNMAWNIACGMRKLHAHNLMHRDIRTDNILVDEDFTLKIGDMGIAFDMQKDSDNPANNIGCLRYMPPEFHAGAKCDKSLDVFTYGLTIYHIFTNSEHTFDPFNNRMILRRDSPIFHELILRCIDQNPQKRPTSIELEATFLLYKRAFDKYIKAEHPNYVNQTIEEKDRNFILFYKSFDSQAKQHLASQFSQVKSYSYDTTDFDELKNNLLMMLRISALGDQLGQNAENIGEEGDNK